MLRLALALTLLAVPAAAQPVPQPVPLAALSAYLDSLTTLEAPFTQWNADGTISTGTLRIARPGRIRFEYAPPDRTLVLSDGQVVAVFDPRSNQPPEQFPLRRTPLYLILAARVDLARERMVVGHWQDGAAIRVLTQDPDNPELGALELVFSADPLALREWVVTDDAGRQTTLILGEVRTGAALPWQLFDLESELVARRLRPDR